MTTRTVACQAPLSMGFPRQEYLSGLPFPSPGDLPNPRVKPRSPALATPTPVGQSIRNRAAQQEVSSALLLPMACITTRIIPLPKSMEKVSSMKPAPGAKKAGDYCCTIFVIYCECLHLTDFALCGLFYRVNLVFPNN